MILLLISNNHWIQRSSSRGFWDLQHIFAVIKGCFKQTNTWRWMDFLMCQFPCQKTLDVFCVDINIKWSFITIKSLRTFEDYILTAWYSCMRLITANKSSILLLSVCKIFVSGQHFMIIWRYKESNIRWNFCVIFSTSYSTKILHLFYWNLSICKEMKQQSR